MVLQSWMLIINISKLQLLLLWIKLCIRTVRDMHKLYNIHQWLCSKIKMYTRFFKLGNISMQTSFSPKTRMAALKNNKAVWKISLQSFSFKLLGFFLLICATLSFTAVSRNIHRATDKKLLWRESYILEEVVVWFICISLLEAVQKVMHICKQKQRQTD